MKKILSMLLASVMVLSLAACSNQPAQENSSAVLQRTDRFPGNHLSCNHH
ncbi:MAG: hypothetical protein V8Q30_07625 [Acutalibacteraceae bacterium]